MSYYDYCDDQYSSLEDDIYYHNYSVDYANQLLGGHHAISSCLPLMRRKHRRYSPRLVRVSTLDNMPIINRHEILPSHSRPKHFYDEDISSLSPPPPPPAQLPTFVLPHLPSLEATSEELERRATRITQPIFQETSSNVFPLSNNIKPSSENTHQPLTETELRQVQQQQEAFQQHLLNMQRQLLEQPRQQRRRQQYEDEEEEEEEERPKVPRSFLRLRSDRLGKRTKASYHDLKLDDDQAEIADLIENDPYIAAAMEDFAYTHGLLKKNRHRTYSDGSSSQYSQRSSKRHRTQHIHDDYHRSPSSSSSSKSSLDYRRSDMKSSNIEVVLVRELHEIRRLMEEYIRNKRNQTSSNYPSFMPIVPMPWSISEDQYRQSNAVHYPPVPPVTDYKPSLVPSERAPPPPEPTRAIYQNVVNAVREVIDQRSPSQRDQPLKPSDIDPKLKHVYTKRPRIPSTSIQRTPFPTPRHQQQSNSSQLITPTTVRFSTASSQPTSNNIPVAPPYQALANFSSSRSTTIKDRNLSYGNRQKQSNIYDTLLPGHYLRLNTNKYN
ncbi:unnamed protein product [Rotaria sp. Silwood1]|nr:unnamed protein product [Rotaria sp. Silwood1]CAF4944519.1 unnamed protein product [Rotaria sp. Silwood1]